MPSYRDRTRRPGRNAPQRRPQRRILVVTEGDVTEPTYLDGLKRHFQNGLVHVQVEGGHGDPRHVVRKTIEFKINAEREARRQRDNNLKYEEAWSVVDVDDHPRLREACETARANNVLMAVSSPCFELWLLLHVRQHLPGSNHRDHIREELQSFWHDYDKAVDFSRCVNGYELAVNHARRLYAAAREANEPCRNPSTAVYRLTESIRIESLPTITKEQRMLKASQKAELELDVEW